MTEQVKTRRKLIEVALPLDKINVAAAREKSIRHGHPSTLHLWWARRPLAAARAVIFSQMVDDPGSVPEEFPTEDAQEQERQRLFRIIEDLVLWENTTNEQVLNRARAEIKRSWERWCKESGEDPEKLPAFHDPFAGGGALPLEAQRLGLESYASDLNPVAVLINKAMIEIPPKFAGLPPVNPVWQSRSQSEKHATPWRGAQGPAEDVRYYGQWMRDEAEKRIGTLYPKIAITPEMAADRADLKPYAGRELTVIAWLWARTVKSPNPAYREVEVPLASSFMLSTKAGKEAYVEPVIEGKRYRFTVRNGQPRDIEQVKNGTKLSRGANFRCIVSDSPISPDYIKTEGRAGRMGARLMAIVAEGDHGRVYLAPDTDHEAIAHSAKPQWKPETALPNDPRNFWTVQYGLTTYADLFTPRQLVALTTFSDLVQEARTEILEDIQGLETSGVPASKDWKADYADAVATYLAFVLSKQADLGNSLCRWEPIAQCPRQLFGRQAIPMIWDYAEGNPLGDRSGGWLVFLDGVCKAFSKTSSMVLKTTKGNAQQADASNQDVSKNKVVSTDPPYYDNIGYADLSDFFYVWLRRSLRSVYSQLFSTMAVPKAEELVATPYRHGSKEKAEIFFMDGMTQAMHRLAEQAHKGYPVTIYYAFKQAESSTAGSTASTGWETFLDAVIRAGFSITGTWPMRTENSSRMIGQGTNALASSVVLVCRRRNIESSATTRQAFVAALKRELGTALRHLQAGGIAPVDLAQAAIGPGMAIYTRHAKVLDAAGKSLSVREALALINQALDDVLAEQEGDFDADTRWALAWFEQFGFNDGPYGQAELLSKAKVTSVAGMVEAGILLSKASRVRLLRPDELPADWDPVADKRRTAWEGVHHLIRVLKNDGEQGAAQLVQRLGADAELARELAYRLYTLCERKKRAHEALAYNGLVQSWPEISRLARETATRPKQAEQEELF
jgi:putative DNA methylase